MPESPSPTPNIKSEPPPPSPPAPPSVETPTVKEEPKPEPEPEEPKFEARWEELPESVVHRILSFVVGNEGAVPSLVRASRVCKKWSDVVRDKEGRRSLWTHLDLSAGRLKEKYRSDKKLESFLKRYRCQHIKEVKLAGWKNSVGAPTLRMLATTCPNLVSLGLASCYKLTNEDLKYIGENFPKLERLDLSNVSVSI